MAKVFTGKVVIPGNIIDEYLKALKEAEEARAPFRKHLENLKDEFENYLLSKFLKRTARKHTSIVEMFIDFLCGYTDVEKIEDITDEKYRQLQTHLVNRPDVGKIISGSGGIRKLRWSAGGHGKRGGIRVIYYWFVSQDVILLLYAYPKSEQDDLTSEQIRQLRKVVEREYL